MKQIPLTPELSARIKAAVGEDVDPSGFAVFEAISLNTLPLPGKDGTIFEDARVSYLTLKQMAESVESGNHLPLIHNHDMSGEPVGRVFAGETLLTDDGHGELRTLFYIDPTEEKLTAKINAGSLDEVSVQFLASQILCSECGFDYRGEDATFSNLLERTCANGHEVGKDGVHVRLVGLSIFTELSLVSRGAASNPKIVGKSQSKLAAPLQQLAARGFEIDQLFLTASKGEKKVDFDKLVAQLTEKTAELAVTTEANTRLTAENSELTTQLEARDTRIAELEQTIADAQADSTEDNHAELETELSAAREFLADVYTRLATAAGETDVEAPETIAELKAGIEKHQSDLTAILPVGGTGVNNQAEKPEVGAKFNARGASAFKVHR